MAINVSTRIVIERPLSEVASFATDPDNATTWYENIKSVEWETEPPYRVGARVAFGARMLGKAIVYTYEVVELVPGSKLSDEDEGRAVPHGDDIPVAVARRESHTNDHSQ